MKSMSEVKRSLIERDGLRCAVSGEFVNDPDELAVDHILPPSKGGSDDLDNLILVSKRLNVQLSNDERSRTHLLIKELAEQRKELAEREVKSFEREKSYRKQLEQQQAELENFRHKLQREQSEREARYQADFHAQQQTLSEQQGRLKATEAAYSEKLRHLEAERMHFHQEMISRELELKRSSEELELEKQKYTEETRRNIERSSNAYVTEALTALGSAATDYHVISRNWSLGGLVSLLLGVGAATYFAAVGLSPGKDGTGADWLQLLFLGLKGVVVVVLLIAIAKYCYGYSQSFMHESLKNSERKHAINFGRFYLQSYGANAEWAQVKEAFEHWNIAPSSAFSKADADAFDPKPIEKAAILFEAVSKLRLANTEGTSSRSS
ncbi:HNH endonuclease domain-containing protein [Pseudomonas coleopterorum]|uniref:HNH endonuclease n=1 Tax=Pseudomonas coleopterorum TaxID=1605838 RepID=UPI002A6A5EB6|nr:HNH endonuclease [Pseudomonas coleopterorum]MDY1045513.1 HNH endonuclease domain-containing protein [Pseudomonas coleopterorum]